MREENLLVVDRLRREELPGGAGEVAERVRGGDEVERPRLGDRLSLLEGDQVGEVVVGLPERLEEVREVLLALLRAARPQWRNAFLAAATAASISSGPALWISASLPPVDGFLVWKVFPVVTSRPSMIGPVGRGRPRFKSSPPA